ncbi:cell division protein FtsN [Pasteurella multocida]|uniref:cell division protein FtsN n=1 Tax=Pasteurella multocida TaxID=747 RepID=UPI002D1EC836|nr:cell division protein FtsN [Pasteurella multocida]MEB4494225.1 cell division protein FtsN [Pasteurella multocida]MEB4502092.1 cell division protein FtsN [Pasteurella multocida]MEB4511655.1 cell division protein FtsN [Pasteurella multocida]MEB4524940.1 cell division protein FtsN [Pasteurella multocida]MEB4532315.1 cell division protein FtsN [Pasteurella multocida]
MARRNYAGRGSRKKKKGTSKMVLLLLVGVIIAVFLSVLMLMKEKTPKEIVALPKSENQSTKSVLPNRPEEVWSYIQALETRTVPVTDDPKILDKNMRLTEEQRKILLAMEQEQKAAEQARLKQQEEQRKIEESKKEESKKEESKKDNSATLIKTNETQNGQAKAVNKPQTTPAVIEVKKGEPVKEVVKVEQPKKVEVINAAPSEKKYGLQCGAFKNKTQAENLQARLAMLGLNARVNSNQEWNRVVIGPVGDRASTLKAQEKAKAIAQCVVIGM